MIIHTHVVNTVIRGWIIIKYLCIQCIRSLREPLEPELGSGLLRKRPKQQNNDKFVALTITLLKIHIRNWHYRINTMKLCIFGVKINSIRLAGFHTSTPAGRNPITHYIRSNEAFLWIIIVSDSYSNMPDMRNLSKVSRSTPHNRNNVLEQHAPFRLEHAVLQASQQSQATRAHNLNINCM